MSVEKSARVGKEGRRRVRRKSVLRMEERGRRVTRLLDLLRALEASRYGLSVRELLDQLAPDCSQRTVYRDLQHLQAAGFAIVEEDSKYRVEGTSLLAEPLRESQVLALLVASDLMTPFEGSSVDRELRTLIDSLHARLNPKGRKWIQGVRSTVLVSHRGLASDVEGKTMDVLEESIIVEQPVEIEYAAPNKPVETRIVEPHLLWCQGGRVYLVAHCRQADAFRNFVLQRVRSARILDEEFERRPDFDPKQHVQQSFGAYHGPAHDVLIRFEKSVAHLAEERRWHPSQKVERLDSGAALLSITVGGLPELAAWLAGLGGQAQALEPPELRDLVRNLHRTGLQAHDDDSSRELTSPDKRRA